MDTKKCLFCSQEHEIVGAFLGAPLAPCPNLPESWMLVGEVGGEPVIVELSGEHDSQP